MKNLWTRDADGIRVMDMNKPTATRAASIHSEMTADEIRAAADALAAKIAAAVPARTSKAFYDISGKRIAR